jgi:hypothetical protein
MDMAVHVLKFDQRNCGQLHDLSIAMHRARLNLVIWMGRHMGGIGCHCDKTWTAGRSSAEMFQVVF